MTKQEAEAKLQERIAQEFEDFRQMVFQEESPRVFGRSTEIVCKDHIECFFSSGFTEGLSLEQLNQLNAMDGCLLTRLSKILMEAETINLGSYDNVHRAIREVLTWT